MMMLVIVFRTTTDDSTEDACGDVALMTVALNVAMISTCSDNDDSNDDKDAGPGDHDNVDAPDLGDSRTR